MKFTLLLCLCVLTTPGVARRAMKGLQEIDQHESPTEAVEEEPAPSGDQEEDGNEAETEGESGEKKTPVHLGDGSLNKDAAEPPSIEIIKEATEHLEEGLKEISEQVEAAWEGLEEVSEAVKGLEEKMEKNTSRVGQRGKSPRSKKKPSVASFLDFLRTALPRALIPDMPEGYPIDPAAFRHWQAGIDEAGLPASEKQLNVRHVSFAEFIQETQKQFAQYDAHTRGQTCAITTYREASGVSADDSSKSFGYMRQIFKAYLDWSAKTGHNKNLRECFRRGPSDPHLISSDPLTASVIFVIEDVSYSGSEMMATLQHFAAEAPSGVTVIATVAFISQYAADNIPMEVSKIAQGRHDLGTYIVGEPSRQFLVKPDSNIEPHDHVSIYHPAEESATSVGRLKESDICGKVKIGSEVEVLEIKKCDGISRCGRISSPKEGWIRLKAARNLGWAARKEPVVNMVYTWMRCNAAQSCTFPRVGTEPSKGDPPIYFDHKMADEKSLGVNGKKAMGYIKGAEPRPFIHRCQAVHACALQNFDRKPGDPDWVRLMGKTKLKNVYTCGQVLSCPYAPYKDQTKITNAMRLCGCA